MLLARRRVRDEDPGGHWIGVQAATRLNWAGFASSCWPLLTAGLDEADLRNAVLGGADLRNAFLIGADLSDANLRGASLIGADLTGSDLTEADLADVHYDERTRWPDDFTPPPSA